MVGLRNPSNSAVPEILRPACQIQLLPYDWLTRYLRVYIEQLCSKVVWYTTSVAGVWTSSDKTQFAFTFPLYTIGHMVRFKLPARTGHQRNSFFCTTATHTSSSCVHVCVSLRKFVWCNHWQPVKLTHSTQSDVSKDDNDKDNTANHISAAPGNRKGMWEQCVTQESKITSGKQCKSVIYANIFSKVSPGGIWN